MYTSNAKNLKAKLRRAAQATLTEIDLRIEAAAKAELYPGHGKRTGVLQRSITGEAATVHGSKVRGRVATKGVRYGRRINALYDFFPIAVSRVRPDAIAIYKKHWNAE
jgi:hypothetical protein